jgi:hypothetical protein
MRKSVFIFSVFAVILNACGQNNAKIKTSEYISDTEVLVIADSTVLPIDKNDVQGILYAFQRFLKNPADINIDSLAQNGRYVVFKIFTAEDKIVYEEKDYNPYNDKGIDENDPPEIWRSAYYLNADKNAISHEYTCVRYCGGNSQSFYRLLPFAHETKFVHFVLNYATSVECIGELDIYDFNHLTGKFSKNTISGILDVTIENFFKTSTPDSLMNKFDYCFYYAYDDSDKYIAQYWFRAYGFYGQDLLEELKEELKKWMLGNVINIYFDNGKLARSEPYFDKEWQW